MKIAISGKSGCGNTTTSKLVASKLGIEFINYTFRNMAEEKGIKFEDIAVLAQKDDSYDVFLDEKQKQLASKGNCIVASRLAIWLIEDADLKVFLTAPAEIRAGRIHKREGGSFEDVLKKTIARDERDSERFKRIYNIDNHNYSHADIIIDTIFYSSEMVAEIIVEKVKSML
ncbi:MAG: cytidylate kinase family protein [Spirochaetaceae bacterium]|nr:cytidylate kinase family protein [Spirochaetaceae bacterium]